MVASLVGCMRFYFIVMPFLEDFQTRDLFALIFVLAGIFFFRENLGAEFGKIISVVAAMYFGVRQKQIR